MSDQIVVTAAGVAYRRREFVDASGRRRIGDKRLSDISKKHHATCEYCGAPITAQRSTMRFCSTKCRMKAHRQRKAAG